RVDGTCYYLPRTFSIWGRVNECRILEEGQEPKTLREYYDFIREKTPGYLISLERTIMFTHLATNLDEWIDWENNTCHFNDGTFEAVLEFCEEGATMETINTNAIAHTSIFVLTDLLPDNYSTSVVDAKNYLAGFSDVNLEEPPTTWNEPWSWVPMPLPSSEYDGYEIRAAHFFAVVDKVESREAAGKFLKWHFLENVVETVAPDDPEADIPDYALKGILEFSINQEECDRYIGRNLSQNEEDEENGLSRERKRYNDTWNIIRNADHYRYFRNAVFDVMTEEAYRYFAGDITAKQAAEYVQNRVSLYLAEQG
ncbi:MAG: hypothetical protein IJB51_09625, partial [Clostridia bacterium]|nr:hypothetical protein [Clostridia bacterium]